MDGQNGILQQRGDIMEVKEAIGKRIRQARIAQGWTQRELADRLGLTAQNISDYERGRADPPSDVVLRLATLFDTPIDWLYGKPVPFEKLEERLAELLRKYEAQEEEAEMGQLEQADPSYVTYPWGYHFRSQLILWKWGEILQTRGYSLKFAVSSRHGYACTIEASSASAVSGNQFSHLIIGQHEDTTFRECCLYMLPSPFKREFLRELFGRFLSLEGIKTNFLISRKSDFFFGYRTNTVEIQFDRKIYTPEYRSSGHGRAQFTDYASLIYAAFPRMFDQDIGRFDCMMAFGGCHRLGTGTVAYLATHPKLLRILLEPKGIAPFEESFEAVFRVEAATGIPLIAGRAISLVDSSRIEMTE
jgi:transcriptional regulator with XRE-family HTH domain